MKFQICTVSAMLSAGKVLAGFDHSIKAVGSIIAISAAMCLESLIISICYLFTSKINCTVTSSANALAVV